MEKQICVSKISLWLILKAVYVFTFLFAMFGSSHDSLMPSPDILDEVATTVPLAARVILFNDEWHTFDEVIEQLIIATGCTIEFAEARTLEVHFAGKSCVFKGAVEKCVRVSSVLEAIDLTTQIEI